LDYWYYEHKLTVDNNKGERRERERENCDMNHDFKRHFDCKGIQFWKNIDN
jgi:hypothetical protein